MPCNKGYKKNTRLKYSKSLFTRKEVEAQKKNLRMKKAWLVSSSKKNYYLTLKPSLAKKYYIK